MPQHPLLRQDQQSSSSKMPSSNAIETGSVFTVESDDLRDYCVGVSHLGSGSMMMDHQDLYYDDDGDLLPPHENGSVTTATTASASTSPPSPSQAVRKDVASILSLNKTEKDSSSNETKDALHEALQQQKLLQPPTPQRRKQKKKHPWSSTLQPPSLPTRSSPKRVQQVQEPPASSPQRSSPSSPNRVQSQPASPQRPSQQAQQPPPTSPPRPSQAQPPASSPQRSPPPLPQQQSSSPKQQLTIFPLPPSHPLYSRESEQPPPSSSAAAARGSSAGLVDFMQTSALATLPLSDEEGHIFDGGSREEEELDDDIETLDSTYEPETEVPHHSINSNNNNNSNHSSMVDPSSVASTMDYDVTTMADYTYDDSYATSNKFGSLQSDNDDDEESGLGYGTSDRYSNNSDVASVIASSDLGETSVGTYNTSYYLNHSTLGKNASKIVDEWEAPDVATLPNKIHDITTTDTASHSDPNNTSRASAGSGPDGKKKQPFFIRHKRCVMILAALVMIGAATMGGVLALLGGRSKDSGTSTSGSSSILEDTSTGGTRGDGATTLDTTTNAPPNTSSGTGKQFASRQELLRAIDIYLDLPDGDASSTVSLNKAEMMRTYGPIDGWKLDTNNITDFSYLFAATRNPHAVWFNGPIADWHLQNDLTQVTSLRGMFQGSSSFNQDLSQWPVSNVVDMSLAFENAAAFSQDLCAWRTLFGNKPVNTTGAFAGTSCPERSTTVDDASPIVGFLQPQSFCFACRIDQDDQQPIVPDIPVVSTAAPSSVPIVTATSQPSASPAVQVVQQTLTPSFAPPPPPPTLAPILPATQSPTATLILETAAPTPPPVVVATASPTAVEPPPTPSGPNTLVQVFEDQNLNTLQTAASRADLVDTWSTMGDLRTIFAPTDTAFKSLPDSYLDKLLQDDSWASHLEHLLLHHSVRGSVPISTQASAGDLEETLTMESGETVKVTRTSDAVTQQQRSGETEVLLNDLVRVRAANLQADNGLVHVINGVLRPLYFSRTVLDVTNELDMDSSTSTSNFASLLATSGLADELTNTNANLTIFAPTDAAFAELGDDALAFLSSEDGQDVLAEILSQHIFSTVMSVSDVPVGSMFITSMAGSELSFMRRSDGEINLDEAQVVASDLLALNGVVHTIDKVILLAGMTDSDLFIVAPATRTSSPTLPPTEELQDCFECPTNAGPNNESGCATSIWDCRCRRGYVWRDDECVEDCSYECPSNSSPRPGREDCVSSLRHCECDWGYIWDGSGCEEAAPGCNTYRCPRNSSRKRNRVCFDNFDDCECDEGYRRGWNSCY